jgi:WD40 repeat protein
VVAGFENLKVTLWDARSGRQLHAFELPESEYDPYTQYSNGIGNLRVNADGRQAAILHNRVLELWDLRSGQRIRPFENSEDYDLPAPIEFSSAGDRLLGRSESAVFVWDVPSGKKLCTISGQSWGTKCAVFSHDGTLVATGGGTAASANYIVWGGTRENQGGGVYIWDSATGKERAHFYGPVSDVLALAFSPDAAHLIVAYANGDVIVLDASY